MFLALCFFSGCDGSGSAQNRNESAIFDNHRFIENQMKFEREKIEKPSLVVEKTDH
jgi:hypothetical protein